MTFAASTVASVNITTTDPASPIDQLVLSPMTGVFPWLHDQDRGQPYSPDFAALAAIGPGKSQVVDLPLNAAYRFDAAGHYSIQVVTDRAQGATSLTTNSVSFDMVPMPDDEEARRAAELEQKIRQAGSLTIARKYAEELDWLTGDPSTRVKLSLFLHPKHFYPFAVDVTKGLWIARNRALVVEELEKALRDPAQELPAGSTLLSTAVALRARLSGSPAERDVESSYLSEIAASLPQRTGSALLSAAQTVFIRLATRNETSSAAFAAAREVVITHFADTNEYNVDWLLNSYGAHLLDSRLVPALRQILADPSLVGERTAVMRHLVKLAPESSRNEVVREVCSDNFTLDEILGELPFSTLAETDECLRRKTDAVQNVRNPMALQSVALRIARFATPALYDDMLELYRRRGAMVGRQTQAYLLAYLVRWRPQVGLPLLETALPPTLPSPDFDFTFALGRVGYVPGIDGFWRECLAKSPPELAALAAFQMSKNGPAEDQALLRARLNDWRTIWNGREVPRAEGRLEGELTQAVTRGAHWQMSHEEVQTLASGCLSEDCRTRFAQPAAH